MATDNPQTQKAPRAQKAQRAQKAPEEQDTRGQEVLGQWVAQRAPEWREIEELNKSIRGSARVDTLSIRRAVDAYRDLGADVSLVQRITPDGRLNQVVNGLFVNLHNTLHQEPRAPLRTLARLYTVEIPAIMQAIAKPIAYVFSLFFLAAFTGWMLISTYPELASLFASETMISQVQSGELWTDDLLNIMPSSLLSWSIFTNNAAVTLFAFALGTLFGLGTLYIIALNGLMLGGIFAFTNQYNMAGRLFEFVIAHGIVEISIICLAGAAGTLLGEALFRPGLQTRKAAFRQAAKQGTRLMFAFIPLLLVCGLIEGYISPNPDYSLTLRVVVGVGWALLSWALLTGRAYRWLGLAPDSATIPD